MENLDLLISELRQYTNETPWIEFKHNNYDPHMIGKTISALANSAALYEKSCAYMIWGIDDKTHDLVGTKYNLQTLKKGDQEIENWLRSLLSPNANFEFYTVPMNEVDIGVLIIDRAENQTVMFEGTDYIRVGSYTKKLNEYPSLQTKVWDHIRNSKFEENYAKQDLALTDALRLLDYSIYFDITGIPTPSDLTGVSHFMLEEGIIEKQDNGLFAITNLGAISLAKNLTDFPKIARKAVRVVQYQDNSRISILKEDTGTKGYAVGFEGLIKFIEALIPSQEVIEGAVREKQSAYPLLAIREAVANALIHQNFSITGTGPTIEIFKNRIEITNSGTPLIDIKRIVDNPPKSRNEKLASFMRRLRMCEELGSGWDRIVTTCELKQLPAPKIELYEESTRVTLFSEIPFTNLSPEDKLWACYLHACVNYVKGECITNSSLRSRFGLKESSSGSISRLIKDAVTEELIKPIDPNTAPRYMKYVPAWA